MDYLAGVVFMLHDINGTHCVSPCPVDDISSNRKRNVLLFTVQEKKLLDLEQKLRDTEKKFMNEKDSYRKTLHLFELEKASHEETKNACCDTQEDRKGKNIQSR